MKNYYTCVWNKKRIHIYTCCFRLFREFIWAFFQWCLSFFEFSCMLSCKRNFPWNVRVLASIIIHVFPPGSMARLAALYVDIHIYICDRLNSKINISDNHMQRWQKTNKTSMCAKCYILKTWIWPQRSHLTDICEACQGGVRFRFWKCSVLQNIHVRTDT